MKNIVDLRQGEHCQAGGMGVKDTRQKSSQNSGEKIV